MAALVCPALVVVVVVLYGGRCACDLWRCGGNVYLGLGGRGGGVIGLAGWWVNFFSSVNCFRGLAVVGSGVCVVGVGGRWYGD